MARCDITASVDRASIHLCMDCAERFQEQLGNCIQSVDMDDMPCGTVSGTVRFYVDGLLASTKEETCYKEDHSCSSLATHLYTLRGNDDAE